MSARSPVIRRRFRLHRGCDAGDRHAARRPLAARPERYGALERPLAVLVSPVCPDRQPFSMRLSASLIRPGSRLVKCPSSALDLDQFVDVRTPFTRRRTSVPTPSRDSPLDFRPSASPTVGHDTAPLSATLGKIACASRDEIPRNLGIRPDGPFSAGAPRWSFTTPGDAGTRFTTSSASRLVDSGGRNTVRHDDTIVTLTAMSHQALGADSGIRVEFGFEVALDVAVGSRHGSSDGVFDGVSTRDHASPRLNAALIGINFRLMCRNGRRSGRRCVQHCEVEAVKAICRRRDRRLVSPTDGCRMQCYRVQKENLRRHQATNTIVQPELGRP